MGPSLIEPFNRGRQLSRTRLSVLARPERSRWETPFHHILLPLNMLETVRAACVEMGAQDQVLSSSTSSTESLNRHVLPDRLQQMAWLSGGHSMMLHSIPRVPTWAAKM